MSTPIEKKIIEIGERFAEGINHNNISDPPSDTEWLKSFLNTALLELLATIQGEVEGMEKKMNHHTCGVNKSNGCCVECSHLAEYNQALSDIKQLLQTNTK